MYDKIAEEFGITQKQAKAIVERGLELIVETATADGRAFCGRGNYFKRIDKEPRNYRNPRTGEVGTTEKATYVVYRKKVA